MADTDAAPGIRLSVTYDGPAMAGGRMDIRVLAGAMASVAQLVEDSARLLHGSDTGIRMEVSGDFRGGSFTYETLATAISGITTKDVKEVLEWLGLIAGASGLTVVGVLKWLRGRPVKNIERHGNKATITTGDGSQVVNLQVAQLVMNFAVRADLEGATQPLAEPGINVMRFGAVADSDKAEIRDDDRPAFLAPPPAAESLHDGESNAVLQVVSPVFKLGNKWQFAYPGETAFFAPILDKKFLLRLQKREVSFAFGDLVRVRMRTQVTRTEAGTMSTSREILEVVEIIPPPHQPDLFSAVEP